MATPISLSFIVGISILGIFFALWMRRRVAHAPSGNDAMRAIASAIQEGARAYMKRQYISVGYVAVVLIVVLFYFLGWTTALGFLIGAVASALAGYLGMMTAVFSNVRVSEAGYSVPFL